MFHGCPQRDGPMADSCLRQGTGFDIAEDQVKAGVYAGLGEEDGSAHQGVMPFRLVKVPVGPSFTIIAMFTIASVPSVTVCGPP